MPSLRGANPQQGTLSLTAVMMLRFSWASALAESHQAALGVSERWILHPRQDGNPHTRGRIRAQQEHGSSVIWLPDVLIGVKGLLGMA